MIKHMGLFDFLSGVFGGLGSLSDDELESRREELRQHYAACQDVDEASRLYDELHRYDEEMTRRANEAYAHDNPDAAARHREHGRYLPNDD